MKRTVLNVAALFLGVTAFSQNIQTITNSKGPVLGYSADSGVKILSIGGSKFKDLNKTENSTNTKTGDFLLMKERKI